MITRFPPRHIAAIFVCAIDDAWLVLAPNGHGWIHGNREEAARDARWLARNFGLPIRTVAA